jgi:hypothetical protein
MKPTWWHRLGRALLFGFVLLSAGLDEARALMKETDV